MVRISLFSIALFFFGAALTSCAGEKKDRAPQSGTIAAYDLKVDRSKLGKTLNLFIYPDYLDPQLVKKFEEVYGVEVVIDYYDNNEAMLAKLQAGGIGQYDVIVPTDYAVAVMRRQNLLQPLDKANIPNLKNLNPLFASLPFDPDNQYTVCYQWGTMGLGVRSDLLDPANRDLNTWKIVFDPEYSPGPFTMLDAQRETIAAALIYLGYSVNTVDEGELQAAQELLTAQRKRVLAYTGTSTARELLVSGDAVVIHNYNGDILMGQSEAPAIRYLLPREGSIIWTDNLAIPAGAPNQYTGEVFINFLLDAENGAILSNFTHYATPNAASLPYLDEKIRNNPDIYPPEEVIRKLQFIEDIGEKVKLYDRVWTRVKAGGN